VISIVFNYFERNLCASISSETEKNVNYSFFATDKALDIFWCFIASFLSCSRRMAIICYFFDAMDTVLSSRGML
jgi:hypothetical protein